MRIFIYETRERLGKNAAWKGARLINEAIREKGYANIIVATGVSQFEMLAELTRAKVDWSKVSAFHLDEYIGIPSSHPASFRKFLKERFVDKISMKAFYYIDGEAPPSEECSRMGDIIRDHPIDVAFVGIGENGHLAFNDPPADFETEVPYHVVKLDEACRMQQLREGWFPSVEDVPEIAISMTVRQIIKSRAIICTVPDQRKAEAVKNSLEGRISPEVPASVLRDHRHVWLYLDHGSSSMLKRL